jgi:nitrous oxidase accessory protein NosD
LLKSTGASAITGSVYKDVINNVIITTSNNASHHGVVTNNAQTHHILNNYIEVANAGAYGIVQTGGSTFVYSAGNTFKGMTTPLNLVNGNQQDNTNDGYGNILIG